MGTKPTLWQTWKLKARQLKAETYALYLAYRDPRTPWYAKAFAALIVAYAFSPIDLIPDFVPVLGYLDDLVLIPAGVTLALKMIPPVVMAECRVEAQLAVQGDRRIGWVAAAVIITIWTGVIVLIVVWALRFINR
jgi:uncharacterized membrane protein YkvA (DUF1232 family)